MASLSYKMITAQFMEQKWNKVISPAIHAILNATDMVCNLAYAVFYGPEDYQGLGVKNPFFFQEITHVIAFLMRPCATLQLANSSELTLKPFVLKLVTFLPYIKFVQ